MKDPIRDATRKATGEGRAHVLTKRRGAAPARLERSGRRVPRRAREKRQEKKKAEPRRHLVEPSRVHCQGTAAADEVIPSK